MELETIKEEPSKKQQVSKKSIIPKRKQVLKKLEQESARILSGIKERANKKQFGRKVRDSEILEVALLLVNDSHIQKLQERTYSEKDRLSMAHNEFIKNNGKISLDQFIGMLLKGELKI